MADERVAKTAEPGSGAPGTTIFESVAEYIRNIVTRREFLQTTGLGAAAFYLVGCGSSKSDLQPRQVYVANALGMVVADSTRCVGCRRCEFACVAFNEGKVQPAIAKVKVNRNMLFGVAGMQKGLERGDGIYGNYRIVQDTCRQCPHPVPCQLACPHGAIEVVGDKNSTMSSRPNARVVNQDKCQGCGTCVQACPWGMTSLDGPANGKDSKATKCTLCDGNPECVQQCPTGALQYVAWQDLTKVIPPRQVVPASIQLAPDVKDTCAKCH